MPRRIVEDHRTEAFDAALEILEPRCRALQSVGGEDVVHQEPVDRGQQLGVAQPLREQHGVPRGEAAVAADVHVPARLGGDHADVLAARLGALPSAPRHAELELVRRPQTPVAQLELDRHAHRVLHAVAAPGGSDARLHRAQRLAVGVSRLEPGLDQSLPDVGQLLQARAEHVDPLAAGDLRVEPEVLGHRADHEQPLGRDLAAGDARHHRVAAVLLQVRHDVIVGVLQGRVLSLQHMRADERREDAGERGLADVAPAADAEAVDDRAEGREPRHAHRVEELPARHVEVLAERIAEGRTGALRARCRRSS